MRPGTGGTLSTCPLQDARGGSSLIWVPLQLTGAKMARSSLALVSEALGRTGPHALPYTDEFKHGIRQQISDLVGVRLVWTLQPEHAWTAFHVGLGCPRRCCATCTGRAAT